MPKLVATVAGLDRGALPQLPGRLLGMSMNYTGPSAGRRADRTPPHGRRLIQREDPRGGGSHSGPERRDCGAIGAIRGSSRDRGRQPVSRAGLSKCRADDSLGPAPARGNGGCRRGSLRATRCRQGDRGEDLRDRKDGPPARARKPGASRGAGARRPAADSGPRPETCQSAPRSSGSEVARRARPGGRKG